MGNCFNSGKPAGSAYQEASGTGKREIPLSTKPSWHRLERPEEQGIVTSIACAPQGSLLFASSWGKALLLYDSGTGKVLNNFQPHSELISKCKFMGEGSSPSLITSSYDQCLKLWDVKSIQQAKQVFTGHEASIRDFCISADNTKLCSGARDAWTFLWDIVTGKKLAERNIARNIIRSMVWIPRSESTFLQCSEDQKIRVWDTRDFGVVNEFPVRDEYFATTCDVDSTGTKLVTGHFGVNQCGCGIYFWDLRKGSEGACLWEFLESKEEIVQLARHTFAIVYYRIFGKEFVAIACDHE